MLCNCFQHFFPFSIYPNRKSNLTSEQFCQATSSMHLYSVKAIRETRWMVESARRYILSGRSLAEMCDHNAGVARELGRHQVAIVCLSFIFCW